MDLRSGTVKFDPVLQIQIQIAIFKPQRGQHVPYSTVVILPQGDLSATCSDYDRDRDTQFHSFIV